MSWFKVIVVLAVAVGTTLVITPYGQTAEVNLAWDAPTSADGTPPQEIAGYKVYYGWTSQLYDSAIDVGHQTTLTISGLEAGQQYYFNVVAYDHALNESPLSEEVSTITTDDPTWLSVEGDDTELSDAAFASTPDPNDWTNYWLKLTMRPSQHGAIGVMFRYQNPDNYYRFSWHSDGAYARLAKRSNGAFTLLAEQAIPYVPGRPYQVEVFADGETLNVGIEGTIILSVDDSDLHEGSIGLYTWFNEGSIFDDLVVVDLATEETLLWEDFEHVDYTSWTVVDEGTAMAPSVWSASNGELSQNSPIHSELTDSGDIAYFGTYVLYTK